MLTLISPAKSQDFKTPAPTKSATQPLFKTQIQKLVTQLKHYEPIEFEKLMKISPKLAQGVFDFYLNFEPNHFTETNAKQALFAFTGDVYKGLEAHTLDQQSIDFAQDHLAMISGLYGLLRPTDLMQPYRLEMGTKFYIDDTLLYDYWRDTLTQALNTMLEQRTYKTIINLASNEYSSAINRDKIKGQWIDIEFKENKDGKYKIIGIHAKRARGRMARYIIDHRIEDVSQLEQFNLDGYTLNPEHSDQSTLCFTR